MTAAPVNIVCANCGAKYKLPADFKAAAAKCKGCGATIDVAGQIKAAAAPAKSAEAQRPPAVAPAARSEAPARASESRGSDATHGRPGAGRRGSTVTKSGSKTEGRAQRGHDRPARQPKKQASKGMLIGSGVAVVVLGVGFYFLIAGGKNPPAPDTTNVADAPADARKSEAATNDPMADAAKAEADALAKELAGGGDAKEAGAPSKAADAAGAATTEAATLAADQKPADPKPAKKEAAAKPAEDKKPLTAADVFDPSSLEPLAFPDYADQALRDEIKSLCDDVRNGGASGRRAKKRLEEIGHAAIPAVINEYQKIDFKNPDQAMYAFELNKFMTNSFGAGVVNAPYKPTQAGEPIPLETADWNGRTVNAWRRFWEKNSDKAAWEQMLNKRKEGKGSDDK